jgi:hypothetical protein
MVYTKRPPKSYGGRKCGHRKNICGDHWSKPSVLTFNNTVLPHRAYLWTSFGSSNNLTYLEGKTWTFLTYTDRLVLLGQWLWCTRHVDRVKRTRNEQAYRILVGKLLEKHQSEHHERHAKITLMLILEEIYYDGGGLDWLRIVSRVSWPCLATHGCRTCRVMLTGQLSEKHFTGFIYQISLKKRRKNFRLTG